MNNIYLELTRKFNDGRVRAILAGGQAVVLTTIGQGREALEAALDAERRQLIRANEERLARYLEATKPWAAVWPALSRQMDGLPLSEAHRLMAEQAETLLPFTVPGGWP